jgi:4-hydroxy-4-methyl-2-oxoglutarate aldolase
MVIERALIEQLHEFETPLVSEALGAMGCPDVHRYYMGGTIQRLIDTPQPMVGVAITLEVDTSSPGRPADPAALYDAYAAVENCSVPAVLVIKTIGSRPDHECVLGDGIAKASLAAGCCGVVTDGGVRDLDRIASIGFSVFATGPVVNHATLVFQKPSQGIDIGGIHVRDGDLVHADHNGVHLVPADFHKSIVEACILSRDFETRAHTLSRRTDKTGEEKRQFIADLAQDHHARCRKLLEEQR